MLGALLMVFVITENLLGVSANYQQEATLFSNYEKDKRSGNNVFLDQSFYPDLRKQNFDRQARSTCVKGVWLFYASRDYSQNENEQMEYYYHVGDSENCVNFRNIGGRVSSARYAGYSNNYRGSTLTVYEKTYFRAGQWMVDRESSDVGFKGVSFIVTGNDPWTIFSERGFGGKWQCVHSQTNNYVPDFIHDTSTINFPNGIRSVRKGCR
ncbi:unnamed protein product [Allacma fusca]|uniref:Uncharacterized protein n=1 Tax=Allacma fusca TaxID=39272 RepID=A0A8J2LMW5_9HEXA|nr:unnamed protein product [Allacma fusca]